MMLEKKQKIKEIDNEIEILEKESISLKESTESKVQPWMGQLDSVRADIKKYGFKNDIPSINKSKRREFEILSQINLEWKDYRDLNEKISILKRSKNNLLEEIRLAEADEAQRKRREEEILKRNLEIRSQMDAVIENYKSSFSLKESSQKANISFDLVLTWFNWGKNGFDENSKYFYDEIKRIDDENKKLFEKESIINQMDKVIENYKNTESLEQASKMANVSYDTVKYWYEWGKNGFGEENSYFYKDLSKIR